MRLGHEKYSDECKKDDDADVLVVKYAACLRLFEGQNKQERFSK